MQQLNLLKTHYEYGLSLLNYKDIPLFDVCRTLDHTVEYTSPITEHLKNAVDSLTNCLDIRHDLVADLVEHLNFCIKQIEKSSTQFLTTMVNSQDFQLTFDRAPLNEQTIMTMRQYVYVQYSEALTRGEIR